MGATAVINQNGQLQPTMMTMPDPNNPEQLVVVQNINGAALDEANAKAMINAGIVIFYIIDIVICCSVIKE